MVTQKDLAAELGMDVSSVNKILNRAPGAIFARETIKRVFALARKRGYDFGRPSKGNMRPILQRLFPEQMSNVVLSNVRGISLDEVRQIKSLLYKSAIVLLTLKFMLPLF